MFAKKNKNVLDILNITAYKFFEYHPKMSNVILEKVPNKNMIHFLTHSNTNSKKQFKKSHVGLET